jgi:hypothetical protein
MKTVFERLYDSEINCSVSSFCWDGFTVMLGDEMNGFKAQTTVDTWAEVEPWLEAQALVHFPNSAFALNTEDTDAET